MNSDGSWVIGYHVPGNCEVTSLSLNMMVGRHAKISLRALAQYKNANTQDELQNAFNGLVNIHVISSEVAQGLRRRLSMLRKASPQRLASLKEALWSVKLLESCRTPSHKLFRILVNTSRGNKNDAAWRPENHEYRWRQFL
jgi:hypothetical protein